MTINMVIKAAAFSYSDQRASDPELHVSSQNMSHTHDVLAGMTCIRKAVGARFLHFRDCVNPAGHIVLQAWHHQISMDSSQSIVFPLTYFNLSRHHPSLLLPCTRSTCTPLPHMPVLYNAAAIPSAITHGSSWKTPTCPSKTLDKR